MKELNRRNTETVEEALRDMYSKIYEQKALIDLQQASISTLLNRLNIMEQSINIIRATQYGSGPSVR